MPLSRSKDFDTPDPRLIAELVAMYEASAARLRAIVIKPPGRTDSAREFNQSRAAAGLAQVQGEISRLKKQAIEWTSTALQSSMEKGLKVADSQAIQVSKSISDSALATGHSGLKLTATLAPLIDHDALKVLALDTVADLAKAADSMGQYAGTSLRRMAATGVSTSQVNQILAGGIIEGKPQEAIRQLKLALQKVHGDTVTIKDKNGDDITFKAGYYAQMVAQTKTRQAVCQARHNRLAQRGIDLVIVVGRVSKNFCTAYLGKAFSISGESKKYPPLDRLPSGGPPFHPNCSKSTAPFIDQLAGEEELAAAAPDAHTDKFLNTTDTTKLQKEFTNSNLSAAVKQREAKVAAEIKGGA